MAATAQASNWMTRLTQEAETLLASQTRIQQLKAEYFRENYSITLTDADLDTLGFADVSNADMVAAVSTAISIDDALGTLSSGGAGNLLALRA